MVEDADGARGPKRPRGWRGGLFFSTLAVLAISNACGGRTVWVEETDENAGEAGEAGSRGGRGGGGYGGSYGGDWGGTYGGSYGGDYGGGYGGSYGGAYGGSYGGAYGGSFGAFGGSYGGVAGAYGGSFPTGGFAGSYGGVGGSFGGSFGGVSGSAGKGGCGAVAGTGGSVGGSPSLGKACTSFCTRFPYLGCPSDFGGPRECLLSCQQSFGLGSFCDYALVDFLLCASGYLDPNAMCQIQGDLCYGPGCTMDAVTACAAQYFALLECVENPRPVPPCPPPPDPPPPPNCGRGLIAAPEFCSRTTECPNVYFSTECYYEFENDGSWLCDCYVNGSYQTTVGATGSSPYVCQTAASACGFP